MHENGNVFTANFDGDAKSIGQSFGAATKIAYGPNAKLWFGREAKNGKGEIQFEGLKLETDSPVAAITVMGANRIAVAYYDKSIAVIEAIDDELRESKIEGPAASHAAQSLIYDGRSDSILAVLMDQSIWEAGASETVGPEILDPETLPPPPDWSTTLTTFSTDFVGSLGGTQAVPSEWPYLAVLRGERDDTITFYCGGAVIDRRWVLTSANCVDEASELSPGVWTTPQYGELGLAVGIEDLRSPNASPTFNIEEIVIHPEYRPDTIPASGENWQGPQNGLALIKLDRPWTGPVMRLSAGLSTDPDRNFGRGFAAGFGVQREGARLQDFSISGTPSRGLAGSPTMVQKAMPLLSPEGCSERISSQGYDPNRSICAGFEAGGVDACTGDSGGPLVSLDKRGRPYQIGIISWGEGCGRPNQPGAYQRVSFYRDWISSIVPDAIFVDAEPETSFEVSQDTLRSIAELLEAQSNEINIKISPSFALVEGDRAYFEITPQIDGRLWILDKNESGRITPIYPDGQGDFANSIVEAGQTVRIPEPGTVEFAARINDPNDDVEVNELIALILPPSFELVGDGVPEVTKSFSVTERGLDYPQRLLREITEAVRIRLALDGSIIEPDGWAAARVEYTISREANIQDRDDSDPVLETSSEDEGQRERTPSLILFEGDNGECTATAINATTLLTNDFCVSSSRGDILLSYLGAGNPTSILEDAFDAESYNASFRVSGRNSANGYVLLNISSEESTRFNGIQTSVRRPIDGEPLAMVTIDEQSGEVRYTECQAQVPALENGVLRHNCSGPPGSNGAPIFSATDLSWLAIYRNLPTYAAPMFGIRNTSASLQSNLEGTSLSQEDECEILNYALQANTREAELARLEDAIESRCPNQSSSTSSAREQDSPLLATRADCARMSARQVPTSSVDLSALAETCKALSYSLDSRRESGIAAMNAARLFSVIATGADNISDRKNALNEVLQLLAASKDSLDPRLDDRAEQQFSVDRLTLEAEALLKAGSIGDVPYCDDAIGCLERGIEVYDRLPAPPRNLTITWALANSELAKLRGNTVGVETAIYELQRIASGSDELAQDARDALAEIRREHPGVQFVSEDRPIASNEVEIVPLSFDRANALVRQASQKFDSDPLKSEELCQAANAYLESVNSGTLSSTELALAYEGRGDALVFLYGKPSTFCQPNDASNDLRIAALNSYEAARRVRGSALGMKPASIFYFADLLRQLGDRTLSASQIYREAAITSSGTVQNQELEMIEFLTSAAQADSAERENLLRQAVNMYPQFPHPHFELAKHVLSRSSGFSAEADVLLETASRLTGDNVRYVLIAAEVSYLRSLNFMLGDRIDDALEFVERAVKLNPSNSAYRNLACKAHLAARSRVFSGVGYCASAELTGESAVLNAMMLYRKAQIVRRQGSAANAPFREAEEAFAKIKTSDASGTFEIGTNIFLTPDGTAYSTQRVVELGRVISQNCATDVGSAGEAPSADALQAKRVYEMLGLADCNGQKLK